MLSDGEIQTTGITAVKETITCDTAGTITIPAGAEAGTVFVYPKNEFGLTEIKGTFTTNTFTATTADELAKDGEYEVGYLINKTKGVQRISFNNKKIPKDYRVEMQTLDKDENGDLIPVKVIAYKATPKRNMELSFSDSGDPASIKLDFDVLCDKNDNVLDILEVIEE